MVKPNEKHSVLAYGFDVLHFKLPKNSISSGQRTTIEFARLKDEANFDKFDGVIIPQGIFEKIEPQKSLLETFTKVDVEENLLYERERDVHNSIKKNKWVCFLVGKVIDKVPQGFFNENSSIRNTDLCKKVLNAFNIERETTESLTPLSSKTNEFLSYIDKYGVAKTIFSFEYLNEEIENKALVFYQNYVVGMELIGNLFFLPFHSAKKDSQSLIDLTKTISNAIIDYRDKRKILSPSWLDEFCFFREKTVNKKLDELLKKSALLENELSKWRGYKTILTNSGEVLRTKIIQILDEFFEFKVDSIDEGREDARIVDKNSNTLFLIEVKGTKRGIKREHINQLDTNRERNDLPISIPGLLIINSEMGVPGIRKRLETTVPTEQIELAKRLNILIIRTIDFLFFMKNLENAKGKRLQIATEIFSSGGGWLKADANQYGVVDKFV